MNACGSTASRGPRRVIQPATVGLPPIRPQIRPSVGRVQARRRRAPCSYCVRPMLVVVLLELDQLPLEISRVQNSMRPDIRAVRSRSAAELTTLYPTNVDLLAAATKAWNELHNSHLLVNAVWDIRTKGTPRRTHPSYGRRRRGARVCVACLRRRSASPMFERWKRQLTWGIAGL